MKTRQETPLSTTQTTLQERKGVHKRQSVHELPRYKPPGDGSILIRICNLTALENLRRMDKKPFCPLNSNAYHLLQIRKQYYADATRSLCLIGPVLRTPGGRNSGGRK